MAANTDASVALTFTTRDQASPGIQRIGGNLTRLQSTAAGVGKVFSQNSTAFLSAGLALATAGGQIAQLGVRFGILNEEQGEILGTTLQVTGVVLSLVTAVASMSIAFGAAGITIGAIGGALAAMLPIILAVGFAAAATGIAIAVLFKTITEGPTAGGKIVQGLLERVGVPEGPAEFISGGAGERLRGQFERNRGNFRGRGLQNQSFQRNPFGGDDNNGRAGDTIVIQAGTIVADEGGMRELEKRLRQIRKEDERTRGISK